MGEAEVPPPDEHESVADLIWDLEQAFALVAAGHGAPAGAR